MYTSPSAGSIYRASAAAKLFTQTSHQSILSSVQGRFLPTHFYQLNLQAKKISNTPKRSLCQAWDSPGVVCAQCSLRTARLHLLDIPCPSINQEMRDIRVQIRRLRTRERTMRMAPNERETKVARGAICTID